MLIRTKIQYTLSKVLIKVASFYQCFDQSLVLIALTQVGKDSLVHFSKKGVFLYKEDFNDLVDATTQINGHLFAICQAQLNQIWIINIIEQKVQKFPHIFRYHVSCQVQIDYFCASRLLCVKQYGSFGQNIHFDYFKVNEAATIDHCAHYQSTSWNPQMKVRKIGTHSKYVWCVDRHATNMRLFQLQLQGENLKFKQTVSSLQFLYAGDKGQAAIIQMWQDYSGKLQMFVSIHDKSQHRQEKNFFNMMIFNPETQALQFSKIDINEQYRHVLIDIYGSQSFCVFHTFQFANSQSAKAPVFYYRNLDGKIIGNQTWQCSYRYKFDVSSHCSNQIIEASFENMIVDSLKMRTISYFEMQEISFVLLSQFIPGLESLNDWDFDILSDILSLLDYSHSIKI